MATTDELKQFLAKRGFDAEVVRTGGTFVISLQSKKIDDVLNLLASINEPGRFVVAVKLGDVVPAIGELLGVFKLGEDLDNLGTELRDKDKSIEDKLNDLIEVRLKKDEDTIQSLADDMKYIKSQSWWKRFLGVK